MKKRYKNIAVFAQNGDAICDFNADCGLKISAWAYNKETHGAIHIVVITDNATEHNFIAAVYDNPVTANKECERLKSLLKHKSKLAFQFSCENSFDAIELLDVLGFAEV